MYRVIVTRPDTNVTTQLRVYAENEEEARENVALNGWQIISLELYDPGSAATRGMDANNAGDSGQAVNGNQNSPNQYTVTVAKIGEGDIEPIGKVPVNSGGSIDFKLKPAPCEKLDKLAVNGELVDVTDSYSLTNVTKDTYVVAFFQKNGEECANNKIDNKDLKELATIYFELGKFSANVPADVKNIITALDKKKNYVIIGHTDDVRVIPNVEYKDNMELSVKRAKFAKSRSNSDNVKIIGMGPSYPVAPNKKEGQPLNRRAVIYERR